MNPTNIKRRFLAGFIDYLIIFSFTWAYIYTFGTPTEDGYEVNGISALPIFLFWLLMTAGLEQLMGATIGKGIVGLKPLHVDRKIKPSFSQSFKRHLLDPIDMFLFGFVAVIAIRNTDKHQRLGDLWAKTIVVKNDTLSSQDSKF